MLINYKCSIERVKMPYLNTVINEFKYRDSLDESEILRLQSVLNLSGMRECIESGLLNVGNLVHPSGESYFVIDPFNANALMETLSLQGVSDLLLEGVLAFGDLLRSVHAGVRDNGIALPSYVVRELVLLLEVMEIKKCVKEGVLKLQDLFFRLKTAKGHPTGIDVLSPAQGKRLAGLLQDNALKKYFKGGAINASQCIDWMSYNGGAVLEKNKIISLVDRVRQQSQASVSEAARTLYQGFENRRAPTLFTQVPNPVVRKIAALVGNPVAHDEKESEKIASKHFGRLP